MPCPVVQRPCQNRTFLLVNEISRVCTSCLHRELITVLEEIILYKISLVLQTNYL